MYLILGGNLWKLLLWKSLEGNVYYKSQDQMRG